MPHDEDRHARVTELFAEVCDLPGPERRRVLVLECGDDRPLRKEIESLLDRDTAGELFLETPALGKGFELGEALSDDDTADRLLVGRTIGHYVVKRLIAAGGMGAVYEAEQAEPHRVVALKVMRWGLASPAALRRFRHESQVLGQLRHESIAQVYEAGHFRLNGHTVPFFAMEFIADARPITDYARANDLTTVARLCLLARVCDAVHHGHQRGVIHRDLKPDNILVTDEGVPKILDFGVARATDSDMQATTLQTDMGQLIGTIPYMSPEQAGGDPADLDTRSDIYALGVIGYELLAGRLPYDVSQRMIHEALRVIREGEPTRLSSVSRVFRGDIETIFAKALEKDRDRRYQSASDLAGDINRYLAHEPIIARPPSVRYQLGKFARRNRGLVSGLAAVFVVLVAGVAVSGAFAIGEREQRLAVEEAREVAEAMLDFLTDDLLFAVDPSGGAGHGKDVLMREVLDEAANRIDEATQEGGHLADKAVVESSIRMALGLTYQKLGELREAEIHLARACDLRLVVLGEEHPDTLESMTSLAILYANLGRLDESESLHLETLEICKRVLGEEHQGTLDSMRGIASVYRSRGYHAEAEELLLELVEILKRVLGEEHRTTLGSMLSLGVLYQELGRLTEAEVLTLETLEKQKRALGEEHPQTLANMNNLAFNYIGQGRYGDAETLLLETLEIDKRVNGEAHPSTLSTKDSLAQLYWYQGRYEESESLHLEILELRKSVLGEDHLRTLDSMYHLARAYGKQGRMDEARPLAGKLLDLCRKQAERSDASPRQLNSCAENLLTCEPPDLRDPHAALRFAIRANDLTGHGNPLYLGTLSLAYHLTGDTSKAIENQEKAIALLPPEEYSLSLEAALADFESALEQSHGSTSRDARKPER